MKWISVKEKLPEMGIIVVIANEKGQLDGCRRSVLIEDGWAVSPFGTILKKEMVTYWMEISDSHSPIPELDGWSNENEKVPDVS
jgi:hypothetical protein